MTNKKLDTFHKMATSLKLFSRAELNDEHSRSLIEKLYVDPLPNDHVFKTLLAHNTTIIIGRKGTGKSTIFQRVQHEIRKNKGNAISAYMDIRNVYEASQVDPLVVKKVEALEGAMTPEQIRRFLLYKRFFRELISDIRNELKNQVEQSFLSRMRERLTGTSAEIFSGLDRLILRLDNPDYENIGGIIQNQLKNNSSAKASDASSITGGGRISYTDPSIEAAATSETTRALESSGEEMYTQLLMRVVSVNEIISELQNILKSIGIQNLYIFLDDYSELPQEAMHLLVDALISPLVRWSSFIKFKIAAYPGRIYLGALDKTKIEEIHLDMYGLYGSAGVAKMEEKATDFVKRLVEKRIAYFCKTTPETYLSDRSDDIWRVLFYASMANPRTLGHLLMYAYDSHLIYNKKIGVQAIQDSAQRFFDDKVMPFFGTGKYRMAFEERSSIYSLKELLESIVSRARSIRQEGSRDAGPGRSRPHSSHFYVSRDFDELLQTLELSFFVTKYFEQSDRAGVRVSVYALNYGLCMKYQISFGRPVEKREDRAYFVERRFDYNLILRSYMTQNQEVRCGDCGADYELSMLPALKMLHMSCPQCRAGTCQVVNLSRKYGDLLEAIRPELLLPETELGILQTLSGEGRSMVAAEIAGELDCSGQLVGRRGKNLADRNLLTRVSAGPVYRYELTDQALSAYFDDRSSVELNLEEDIGEDL